MLSAVLLLLLIASIVGVYLSVPLPRRVDIIWHLRNRRQRQNSYMPRHAAHS